MIKASSLADAKAKAKSCVVAATRFTPSGFTFSREFVFIAPKSDIGSEIFVSTGFYLGTNTNGFGQLYLGTQSYGGRSQGTVECYFNGTQVTCTTEYYYD